jgi:hypothetical protein
VSDETKSTELVNGGSKKSGMAKKSRRARQTTKNAQPVRISRPVRPLGAEAAPKRVNFAEEYHYVIEDLRRIAIIAVALLILLIVLAFIIG